MADRITIKDVAKAAGVSTTLVSRVMNAAPDADGNLNCAVNKSTAERILRTVKALGYRPNTAAASLRKKRNNRIGVILPDIGHNYFSRMARLFETVARNNGFTVLFGSSDDDPELIGNLVATFCQDNVDGIILVPSSGCRSVVEGAVRQRVPIVLTSRDIPGMEDVGKVILDNVSATQLALSHLVEQGYRKIEMLSITARNANLDERERLYMEYMESRSLPGRILHCQDKSIRESVHFIVEDACRRGVDALYCPNAFLPVECMNACKDMGIRIPEDLAVMGYDGDDLFDIATPKITQISFSEELVATESFRILRESLDNRSSKPARIVASPVLITGGSTVRSTKVTAAMDGNPDPAVQIANVIAALRRLEKSL